MRKCPACGFTNTIERTRCLKCNALLESRALPTLREGAIAEGHGIQLLAPLRRASYFLGRIIWRELPENVPYRWTWTAAMLAVIPGLGAWYNHQPIKAVIFGVLTAALWVVFLVTFFHPWNDVAALALVLWTFYAMADAFVTAARLNGTLWGWRHLGAVWFAMMFIVAGSVFAVNFLGQAFFLTTTIRTDVQRPGFRAGDKVFVLTRAIAPEPRSGAVIYYDPERYVLQWTNAAMGTTDELVVNEKSAMGVVTAVAGERLTVAQDGRVLVNGQPVGAGRLPPNPNGAPMVDVQIPPRHIGVLLTHGAYEGGAMTLAAMAKGEGGVYGLEHPTPRDIGQRGMRLSGYEDVVMVRPEALWGTAIFRYHPPERRAWWGFRGPLFHEAPADYPRPF